MNVAQSQRNTQTLDGSREYPTIEQESLKSEKEKKKSISKGRAGVPVTKRRLEGPWSWDRHRIHWQKN